MLSWLVLLLTVLGAVAWGCAPVGRHRNCNKRSGSSLVARAGGEYQQYSTKSSSSSSARSKVAVRGRLADGELRPMAGVEVFVDASDCSLSLPIDTSVTRKPCQDKRVIGETDSNGDYQVFLRVDPRKQRYLNVRFAIAREDRQPERLVIPLQSVDQMLGQMPAGSYYRLDRDEHRQLLAKRRDLVYTSSEVVMTANQLDSLRKATPFSHKENLFFSIADVVGGVLAVINGQCTSNLNPAVHQNTQPIAFHFLLPRDWGDKKLMITGITSPICIDPNSERT